MAAEAVGRTASDQPMKRIPTVGWAFFGLAVVIYVVYLLNRGVYIGDDFEQDGNNCYRICKYLHLTGISTSMAKDAIGRFYEAAPAKGLFCPPLKSSN
jgi:hypothetical protein